MRIEWQLVHRRRCVLAVVTVIIGVSACSQSKDVGSVETVAVTVGVVPTTSAVADLTELAIASGNGDPAEVAMPPAPDLAGLEWLEGPGAIAADLLDATAPLWAIGSSTCQDVARSLDALGTPQQILAAASATPDSLTSEVLVSLHGATGRALSSCLDDALFSVAVADFAWQWALADRRLDEMGVAR